MDDAERRRILFDWNRTDAPFSSSATLHRLFERSAGPMPSLTFTSNRSCPAGASPTSRSRSRPMILRNYERRAAPHGSQDAGHPTPAR